MNKAEAQMLRDRPFDRGVLTGEESLIVNANAFTTADTTITYFKVHYEDSVISLVNSTSGKVLYKDERLQHMTKSKSLFQQAQHEVQKQRHHMYYTQDPDTGVLLRFSHQVEGLGLNAKYLYKSTPAFKGQTPSENASDESVGGTGQPLFLYGRILAFPAAGDFTQCTGFSVVFGYNPDTPITGLGFQWKDVYQGIRPAQFEYAAFVVDMAGSLLLKSTQDNHRMPTFAVGPNVDADHAILCCVPLLPDGSLIWKYVGFAGWLI